MTEYAIRSSKGHIIEGPGWTCIADVMAASHGQGTGRIGGTLVKRVDGGEWEPVDHERTPAQAAVRHAVLEAQHAFVRTLEVRMETSGLTTAQVTEAVEQAGYPDLTDAWEAYLEDNPEEQTDEH